MSHFFKRMLNAIAPKWTTALASARSRALSHKLVRSWGCVATNEKVISHLGPAVQGGPFRGVVLGPMARSEHLGPYLLGTHESELDVAWNAVFAGDYTQVIDVGAKFGYYAVGLAKRFPNAAVIAFDTDRWARKAMREMIDLNKIANMEVRGFCDTVWLRANLRDAAFILSDCEGYEDELFTRSAIPALGTTTLIIETHDWVVPGVADRLQRSLAGTHLVYLINSGTSRRMSELPLDFLTASERELVHEEFRPAQVWLLCLPKFGPNQTLCQQLNLAPAALSTYNAPNDSPFMDRPGQRNVN